MSRSNSAQDLLFEEFYEWRLEDSPELATMVGEHKYDDKLESYRYDAFEHRREKVADFLKRAEALSLTKRSVDLDLFKETLQLYIEGYETQSYVFPLSRIEGVHVDLLQTISYMKFETEEDFEKLGKRLSAVPEQIEGIIQIMHVGIGAGLTLHPVSMENVIDDLTKIIDAETDQSPFYKPVISSSISLPDSLKQSLLTSVKTAQLGFFKLREFLRSTYIPRLRKEIGIVSVAGEAYYAQCLKFHLGFHISAQEVHNMGLREVERIKSDTKKIIAELGLTDTPIEFARRMTENTSFYFNSQEELKEHYEAILSDRIQPQLEKFFRKLPKAKLNLELMAKSRAAGPVAYYIQGSSDGTRPGTFYINGNDLRRSPTFILPALALHEANPGHHLQGSRLLETPNLAKFRLLMEDRQYTMMPTHFPMHTAYTEGWGLYSEYLGHEMGVYTTPYERYGHYSQEMLRACRLVVDTGMHALGWSREQAVRFLAENVASSLSEINSEIDRYITWPGQACGYKVGEIRLKELRQKAADSLGDKFDIRDFHEVVMNNVGTMEFLAQAVDDYIKENQ